MKILTLVDVAIAADTVADFTVVDLPPHKADQLLRQYQGFCKLRELPGPKPEWMTLLDDSGITFFLSNNTVPQFEELRGQCRQTGYMVLPESFPETGPEMAAARVPGVKPHLIISKAGISWHGLLRQSAHHATAVLPPSLLERAIGITLSADPSDSPS